MPVGTITFVSPKGYGMVRLKDGRSAFLPSDILLENNYKADDEIEVEVEAGEIPGRLRVTSIAQIKALVEDPKPRE